MNTVWRRVISHYHGRIIGTVGAIILALLIIHYGIFRTSFILGLGAIGFLIGSRIDSDEDLRSILERVLPPVN